ncbi:hypothetical protein DAH37_20465 [Escherichia coli]|nr:hypothetical protein DAH37_20465 [Escherichia coli]
MLSKTGFTHSDLLNWQIEYAGGSLNVNGPIMRDTYTFCLWSRSFIFNCMRTNHQYKEILKIVLNSALDM